MNKAITKDDQYGMTYAGMLILMIFIAVIAIVVIKVVPLYLEHFKVESSLKSLAEESRNSHMAPNELEKHLLSRLAVNDVQHVTRDDITVTKEGGKTIIDISYEARVPLFYNLDMVAKFPDNHVELGGP